MTKKYNYKFICENDESDEYLFDFLTQLGSGKKSIEIFNKDSSLQDILEEEEILKEIELYYGEAFKESEKCKHIIDYMQDVIIIKY